MKNIKSSITIILSILAFSVFAQKSEKTLPKGVEEVKIQTSAQCEDCKERIEKNMAFEKGVKYADLDLETKILTLQYKTSKTDAEKLREAVAKIGYDADDVSADPKAYEKLPACCQKGGHDHKDSHDHP